MPSRQHWVYNHPAWATVKQVTLDRAHRRCQVQLPGCTIHATTADHIVSLAEHGLPFDLGNLRAACKHCNSALAAHRTNWLRTRPQPSRQW